MNDKTKAQLQAKLSRLKTISSQLELADGICFSIEDLNDAYIEAKVQDLKQKMDKLADKLSLAKDQDSYQRMYHQLEDYEQAIYLLEKNIREPIYALKRCSKSKRISRKLIPFFIIERFLRQIHTKKYWFIYIILTKRIKTKLYPIERKNNC